MELGALICTATRPLCTLCPLRSECKAYSAWKKADEEVFYTPPVSLPATRAIAVRSPAYATSNRYFRGRIVALLRELSPGSTVSVAELGPKIKEDWTDEKLPWLSSLLHGLATDGLIVLEGDSPARLAARLP